MLRRRRAPRAGARTLRVAVVAVDVAQQTRELARRRRRRGRAALLEAVADPLLSRLARSSPSARRRRRARRARRACIKRLQRGENLAMREIARRAEQHERVDARRVLIGSPLGAASARALRVAAELESHRGQQPVRELVLAARAEAREQRGCEHRHRHAGGSTAASIVQRPSPESDTSPRTPQARRSRCERPRREIEQPRAHHAAVPPDLGDLREIEVVREVLGRLQRRVSASRRRRARRCRRWRGAAGSCPPRTRP